MGQFRTVQFRSVEVSLAKLGVGVSLDNFFGSTNIVAQLSFSMLSSIVTFEFDLVLGLFLTFWGPNGLFCSGVWFKNYFWLYSCS